MRFQAFKTMSNTCRHDINVLTLTYQALCRRFWAVGAVLGLVAAIAMPSAAQEARFDTPSGSVVPRWAILGKNEINARNGPSLQNRTLWKYTKAGVPVQIISETREWRLICDPGGGVAWVKRNLLRPQRNVVTPDQSLELMSNQKPDASVKAVVRPRSVAQLDKCHDGWCRISVGGQKGWVPQDRLWGTQDKPVCARPDSFALR